MSNSIDQQFVEYIVKSLVGKPDEVKIERRIDEKGVLLELTVDPEDLGRVIGKRGATAQSLRTLLRALGTKNDARYNLKIVDNGVEGGSRGRSNEGSGDGWSSKPSSSDDDASTSVAPVSKTDDDVDDVVIDDSKDDNSETISKARKELEDLDDLDI
jgi:predicted RNA-binding protein YlqC (UPF0109 family)